MFRSMSMIVIIWFFCASMHQAKWVFQHVETEAWDRNMIRVYESRPGVLRCWWEIICPHIWPLKTWAQFFVYLAWTVVSLLSSVVAVTIAPSSGISRSPLWRAKKNNETLREVWKSHQKSQPRHAQSHNFPGGKDHGIHVFGGYFFIGVPVLSSQTCDYEISI